MSVRTVWIISLPVGDSTVDTGRFLFARVYPTVESRVKKYEGEKHVELPENRDIADLLLGQLGLKSRNPKFIASRDSCLKYNHKPVFELNTSLGKLWPVVVIEQHGLLYCCVPAVDQGSYARPPLITVPGISAGITLLMGMADFVGILPPNVDETCIKFADLYLYLSQAAPFGTPIDVNAETIKSKLAIKPSTTVPPRKQPAWKPVGCKAKPSLYFSITEQIRAVQYDNHSEGDVWDIYGSVTCSAELDAMMPEVCVNMVSLGPHAVPLNHITIHPCTQSADAHLLKTGLSSSSKLPETRKLRFMPPAEMFVLCHYTANIPDLPIKGFYQMKGEKMIELLMELKLSDKMKNSFNHCLVHLPFYHRGTIVNFDAHQSYGTVSVSGTDPRMLIWNIGQKFPKSQEALLKATVHFKDYNPTKPHGFKFEDPFCIGPNAYAQIYFKVSDFTHTGCSIDLKSVQITPHVKVKVAAVLEYSSADFKIWNSHGDAQIAFTPPKYLTQ